MAWPSVSARTKNWGSEVLTDSDLEGQYDLIHTYINAFLNSSTGHGHTGTTSDGPKLNIAAALTIASQAQGDILYASSASAWARLGAGTAGQFLQSGGAAANPSWATVPQAPRGSFSGLAVTKASNSTLTATANDLIVYDASNIGFIINTYNKTADITVAGAGGLDTGAEAANTLYYVWAIRKSSDGTNSILLSASATAPTMPSGYDQKALISVVGNNNSSNFIAFHQYGRKYTFDSWAVMATGNVGAAAWTSIDMTPANLTTNAGFVPSALSNFCYGSIGESSVAITNDNATSFSLTTGQDRNKFLNNASSNGFTMGWQLDILTADTLYWASGSANSNVWLHGFDINKLV